jgi:hypothetical protein
LHACPRHGSWATFIPLSHARAKSEIRRFKIVTSQLRETTLTENIGPPGQAGVVRGADTTTLEKTLVTKSEEARAGYFSWQKLLRKARAYIGMSSQ